MTTKPDLVQQIAAYYDTLNDDQIIRELGLDQLGENARLAIGSLDDQLRVAGAEMAKGTSLGFLRFFSASGDAPGNAAEMNARVARMVAFKTVKLLVDAAKNAQIGMPLAGARLTDQDLRFHDVADGVIEGLNSMCLVEYLVMDEWKVMGYVGEGDGNRWCVIRATLDAKVLDSSSFQGSYGTKQEAAHALYQERPKEDS